jgi:hypothetical protein
MRKTSFDVSRESVEDVHAVRLNRQIRLRPRTKRALLNMPHVPVFIAMLILSVAY